MTTFDRKSEQKNGVALADINAIYAYADRDQVQYDDGSGPGEGCADFL